MEIKVCPYILKSRLRKVTFWSIRGSFKSGKLIVVLCDYRRGLQLLDGTKTQHGQVCLV